MPASSPRAAFRRAAALLLYLAWMGACGDEDPPIPIQMVTWPLSTAADQLSNALQCCTRRPQCALFGVASNCGLTGIRSMAVTIRTGETADAVFTVICHAMGPSASQSTIHVDPASITIGFFA